MEWAAGELEGVSAEVLSSLMGERRMERDEGGREGGKKEEGKKGGGEGAIPVTHSEP